MPGPTAITLEVTGVRQVGTAQVATLCFDATGVVGVYNGFNAYGRDVLPDDDEMAKYIF